MQVLETTAPADSSPALFEDVLAVLVCICYVADYVQILHARNPADSSALVKVQDCCAGHVYILHIRYPECTCYAVVHSSAGIWTLQSCRFRLTMPRRVCKVSIQRLTEVSSVVVSQQLPTNARDV